MNELSLVKVLGIPAQSFCVQGAILHPECSPDGTGEVFSPSINGGTISAPFLRPRLPNGGWRISPAPLPAGCPAANGRMECSAPTRFRPNADNSEPTA